MVKIYKYNNKLAVYLPFDVIKELRLTENDEIDFFHYNEKAFIFAKKADIANMIMGGSERAQAPQSAPQGRPAAAPMQAQRGELSAEEIAVLKKLDTLRYNQRTQANVDKLLNAPEKEILRQLIRRKAVTFFRSEKEKTELYGISKVVYDRFLMRKREGAASSAPAQAGGMLPEEQSYGHLLHIRGNIDDENIKALEKNGFIVLQTESEAASVSAALEDSIRHGQVFGTRAFNKKFYIMLRAFLEKNSGILVKELKGGERKVSDLAEKMKIDENGIRALLYYMSEIGDVSEKRRDVFRLA